MRNHLAGWLIILPCFASAACAREAGGNDSQSNDSRPTAGTGQTGSAIKTAKRPASVCDWLPIADVEAILGPVVGPPKANPRSCRYRLPIDSATARRRAEPDFFGRTPRRNPSADSVWVLVAVDLDSDLLDERAGNIATGVAGGLVTEALGTSNPAVDTTRRRNKPAPAPGWDFADVPVDNDDFRGRIGNLVVKVEENADVPAVTAEKKSRLAGLMRDRIPDLPFPVLRIDDAEPVTRTPPRGPDPCSLLTRDEAEGVLGKLVVPPYRSHDGGPLYDEWGKSCAYFTPGHRTFVVTPHWTDGKDEFAYERPPRVVTGFMRDKAGAAADTLNGPWDDVTLGLDGSLSFLKGDRMLKVAFGTSSANQTKALELVRIALERLAAYQLPRP